IGVIVTDVGDHRVIEAMRERGCNLGGEQSGHVIFMDHVTTGDGIITALHVLKLMKDNDSPLRKCANFMTAFPQKMVNLPVREKIPLEELDEVQKLIREVDSLGSARAIVRYSGTENKMRILVEAPEEATVKKYVASISEAALRKLK
ncbi:MAG: phosphoglucosamine mutase, partial [Lentisphaeria bacterium]|nr:phosphoglucosamine mutase [Lentisphaeria bacterium]